MRSVENTNQALIEAASQLAGEAVVSLASAGAGANSHVLRATTPTRTLGLKCYPHRPGDPRDRLDVEWRALRFLRGIGLEAVPEALGRDDANQMMLMEWIEGELVSAHSPADLDAAPVRTDAILLWGMPAAVAASDRQASAMLRFRSARAIRPPGSAAALRAPY